MKTRSLLLLVALLFAAPAAAQNVQCSQFPPSVQAEMKAGQRLDPTQPWKLNVYAQAVGDPYMRDKSLEVGTRADIVDREVVMRAGLDAMIKLDLIVSYITLTVPQAWKPGDPFVYPAAPCP